MPHTLNVETDGPGATISLSGIVEADEVKAIHKEIEADLSFPQWRYQIWDFSNSEELHFSFDHLRQFAIEERVWAKINPNLRIAIVPRRSTYKGLDRMYGILERVWGMLESRSFWTLDAARAWARTGQEPATPDAEPGKPSFHPPASSL